MQVETYRHQTTDCNMIFNALLVEHCRFWCKPRLSILQVNVATKAAIWGICGFLRPVSIATHSSSWVLLPTYPPCHTTITPHPPHPPANYRLLTAGMDTESTHSGYSYHSSRSGRSNRHGYVSSPAASSSDCASVYFFLPRYAPRLSQQQLSQQQLSLLHFMS